MCLYIDREKTKELKKSGQEFVTRYKILRSIGGKVVSPINDEFVWHVGYNKCKYPLGIVGIWLNKLFSLFKFMGNDANYGIHVYNDSKIASSSFGGTVVEVKSYIKDLIAVGTHCDEVYNKVWLSQENYDQALLKGWQSEA